MTNSRTILSTTLLLLLFVASSFAHHSLNRTFDTTKRITIKGRITKVEWRNPHASFYMDVRDASGKITNWWVEVAGVAALTRAGLDQSMIDMNQTYATEGFQAMDGSAKIAGLTLTFPDSKSYDVSDKFFMNFPPAK
jgi:hypothetical protein